MNSVSLNKRLEEWAYETLRGKTGLSTGAQQLEIASSLEVLNAINRGGSIYKDGFDFEVLKKGNSLIFKNHNELTNSRKLSFLNIDTTCQSLQKILAVGFIPSVITTHSIKIGTQGKDADDLNFWQYPCATEKQAYENHLDLPIEQFIDFENRVINTYLPLPWATYIDKLDYPEPLLASITNLLMVYRKFAETSNFSLRIHTVCQHIHWRKAIGRMHEVGVTDLHLSHKYSQSVQVSEYRVRDMQLHCWPLIAVNYVSPGRNLHLKRTPVADKKLLASFIGAQMSHYRDESRVSLYNAATAYARDSVVVELGKEWHYNKIVYEEQVQNISVNREHAVSELEKTSRYNRILSDSIFSLCPEGAGPNTLRFWESIAVGSIPVIFSKDVAIFQESEFSERLLQAVIHWQYPVDAGLYEYLESIPLPELEHRRKELLDLYPLFEKYTVFNSTSYIEQTDLARHSDMEFKDPMFAATQISN